jgi:hypothetical protein
MPEQDVDLDEVLSNPTTLAFLEQHGVKFRVTALPEDVRDDPNARWFYLYIERKAPGRWAVSDGTDVLSRTGLWRYESLPSARTDKFKEVTRFPLAEAFKLAQKAAAKMQVAQWTVESITEDIRRRQSETVAETEQAADA